MRSYILYIAVALLAFGIGAIVVAVNYFTTEINVEAVEEPDLRRAKYINKVINRIEAENAGCDELLTAKSGDLVTVQGLIDEKFLCHDLTDSQTDICTTVLMGNSSERKSLVIRFQMCKEGNKSNCIVLKPNDRCSYVCPDQVRIYDNNSKPTDLVEEIQTDDGKRARYHKSPQLKVTGEVTIVDNKPRLLTPIEKIEITKIQ